MDMFVLRFLDSLCNIVGLEIIDSGDLWFNGVVLVFDKFRLGLFV